MEDPTLIKAVSKLRRNVSGLALVVVALLVAWMGYAYGGYYVSSWALAAFLMAMLMLTVAVAGKLGGARSLWSVVATSLFIGYSAWTFASIAWSSNKGDAWFGSGLTLLYLLVFWLSATLIAMNASHRWALSALAIGPGVIAAITVTMLDSGTEDFFLDGRLMGTAGYFNAEAAFLLVSFWVAMYVTGSPRIHPALRAAALASAVIGIEVAVLTQSRGALISLAVSLPVFFIFSSQRLRGLLALIPVIVSLLISFPTLNGVYIELSEGASIEAATSRVAAIVIVSCIAVVLYSLVWSLVETRWRPSPALTRVAGAAALVCVALSLIAGSVVFVQRAGNPVSWVQETVTAFKSDDSTGQVDGRYFSASGSGRYTIWKIAWNDFTEHPLLGVGTHNFEATYYQDRDKNIGWIRQPHSLPLEVLSERGIVGGVLFFGFLGTCIASGLWKRFRSLSGEGKAQIGALLAAVTYWFVHCSAEWFWQIPAVTIPAMIYLAMLVTPWSHRRSDEDVFAPSTRPLRLAGIGLAVLTLVAIGPLYIADRLAASGDPDNPWDELARVEQARAFNPLDPQLAQREAELAVRVGNYPLAERAYAREISLNPEHYAPYTMLGGIYETLGQRDRALMLYEEARKRNPLDPDVAERIERIESESS